MPAEEPDKGTPAALHYLATAQDAFPDVACLGIRAVRTISGTRTWSQHAYGNAVDLSLPGGQAVIAALFEWTVANAKALSVAKAVFDGKAWSRGEPRLRAYRGADPHHDHVHVDFWPSWEGNPPGRPARGGVRDGAVANGVGPSALVLDDLACAARDSVVEILGDSSVAVAGLSHDGRRVREGDLYFCVDATVSAERQARRAERRGAAALSLTVPVQSPLPQLIVRDGRAAMAQIAAAFYGRPGDDLLLLGVTGTNGKTTTAILLQSILAAAGHQAGFIGSLAARLGSSRQRVPGTTPDPPTLHRLLAEMKESGLDAAAMEVSSHALALRRVDGLRFAAAAFTNLSPDHLDYHRDIEGYFGAKARLFTPEYCASAAINVDDSWGRRLEREALVPVVRFGRSPDADVRARDVRRAAGVTSFRVVSPWGESEMDTFLMGDFNVSNCLAAASTALAAGIDLESVRVGLAAVRRVPGRFDNVDAGQDFTVIVDFARTPEALAAVLRAARLLEACDRLICVFGCPGDAEHDKRPRMGRVAARLADRIMVTMDSPGYEDPTKITTEILAGMDTSAARKVTVVLERERAIRRAIDEARPGDVVLLAGRGVESTQQVLGKRVRLVDSEVALQALREKGWAEEA